MPNATTDVLSQMVPPRPVIDHDTVITCDNRFCPSRHLLREGILVAVVSSADQIARDDIPVDAEKIPQQLCVYGRRDDVTMQVCKSCGARRLAGLEKPPDEYRDFTWLIEGDICLIEEGCIVGIKTVDIDASSCLHCPGATTQ